MVGDVARPVLGRRALLGYVQPDCDSAPDDPYAPCRYELPGSRQAAWLVLEPALKTDATPARDALRDRVAGPVPRRSYRVVRSRPEGGRLAVPAWDAGPFRVHAVPPVARQWIETQGIEFPEDATVRFSIGVEPSALEIDSAPVDFVVRAYEGRFGRKNPIELFRASLDPSAPEARHWIDHEISLAPLAGKLGRLRFETLPTDPADRRPQLPLWGDPTIFVPEQRRHRSRPFVVLVSLDTLRARSLSALGRTIETSPFFDALAQQGTLFEQAFTTYSNTLGSHMSMLTGLWPKEHGVTGSHRLPRRKITLAERMRAAGYDTAAFTEDALLNGAAGFRRGFGRYAEDKEVAIGGGAARETFAAALAWAQAHADTPFFLFVHTYEVHAPYVPEEPYADLFSESDARRPAQRRYEQEIRYLDDQLRDLVGGLDRLLGAGNLLLVVTADHGEEFGEHGFSFHTQLYDEVMHVPLLFRLPPTVPAGKRIARPVSLVDVAPTILDLTGVRGARRASGRSLRPLFDDGVPGPARTLFGESPASMVNGNVHQFVGRNATHKCMIGAGRDAGTCFDLTADPDESSPLPPNHDAETRALHDALIAYRDARPPQRPPAGARVETDPRRREKLRALGYVE